MKLSVARSIGLNSLRSAISLTGGVIVSSTQDSETLNIYQRLNEVRKEVKYVQKDAQVANQYKAVTHDQVTSVTREHLVAQGIMVVPTLKSSTFEGGLYAGTFEVSFIRIDRPEDRLHFVKYLRTFRS